ncbi:MAG: DUF1573 domain-containing protein [Thermaerobacter sp.]|nr:DUF1573 domain-containing protein [Bacillota bacterium]REJ38073.1 MAG: DUF1573 domain-containing protein [Bacillota bacterium]
MKDLLWDEFQDTVSQCLIRHRSILDVISKFQEAGARVNRAVLKAVTSCGCVSIEARKAQIPPDITLGELRKYMDSHLRGQVCEHCREVVEDEVGKLLFYLAGLCNALDLNLYDILIKEHKKVSTLGQYSLT